MSIAETRRLAKLRPTAEQRAASLRKKIDGYADHETCPIEFTARCFALRFKDGPFWAAHGLNDYVKAYAFNADNWD